MKLKGFKILRGTVYCKTGLRIGGAKDDIEIGTMDNPIVRHPITGLPYLPGSSLKGKMRSLLELRYSPRTQETGKPCDCGTCKICRIFGSGSARTGREPTRILVRDAWLTNRSGKVLTTAQEEKGLNFAEIKSEVLIDRQTGRAAGGIGPRTQERVPADTEFELEISLRLFEGDDEQEARAFIEEGLHLVEQDALGGSGSRGYGKVEFRGLSWGDSLQFEKAKSQAKNGGDGNDAVKADQFLE